MMTSENRPGLVSDRLPSAAQDRLAAIAGAAADALEAAQSAQRRLNQLPDNTTAEARRLQRALDDYTRRRAALAALSSNCYQWLRALPPDAALETAPAVVAAPKDGETLPKAIARVRLAIAEVVPRLRSVRAAPLPKADMAALVRAEVAAMAVRGKPVVSFANGKTQIDWFKIDVEANHPAYTADILAWLNPDQMAKALERDLPDAEGALSAREKADRIAQFSATLDGLEREEEALVQAAEAAGIDTMRRVDAGAAAVLGVRVANATARQVA